MSIKFNRQKKKGNDSQVLKKSQVTSYTIITLKKHKRIIKKTIPEGLSSNDYIPCVSSSHD